MKNTVFFLIVFALLGMTSFAQEAQKRQRNQRSYPPEMSDARTEVYKTVGDVNLNIYVFVPEGHKSGDRRPAIVFFFGGGWRSGSPSQFEQHCKYLASRGMVAMAADYRVSSRHDTKALQCVADGKSAVRWIRANAKRLGVDPDRVAAGGGSAGGHVAACTGTIAGLDEEGEDTSISSKPNCLTLFNPAVVLAPVGDQLPFPEDRMAGLMERMGIQPEKLSPYHNVSRGDPPTILFHGTGDTTVPFRTAEVFAERMKELDNLCELVPFEDRPHGFFNYGRNENKDFKATVRAMDEFLAEQGFLKGKPTIE
jgi:acetyl esterase/lipase